MTAVVKKLPTPLPADRASGRRFIHPKALPLDGTAVLPLPFPTIGRGTEPASLLPLEAGFFFFFAEREGKG